MLKHSCLRFVESTAGGARTAPREPAEQGTTAAAKPSDPRADNEVDKLTEHLAEAEKAKAARQVELDRMIIAARYALSADWASECSTR